MNRFTLFLLRIAVGIIYCVALGFIGTFLEHDITTGVLIGALLHLVLGVSSFTGSTMAPIMGSTRLGSKAIDETTIREAMNANAEMARHERGLDHLKSAAIPKFDLAKEILWRRNGWDLILTAIVVAVVTIAPMFYMYMP